MESSLPQNSNGEVTTIESNNFHQVLDRFDGDGHLVNPNTRFNITCSICNDKHLAIVNNKFDKKSRKTHEVYTVLPRCQHAFGYSCLIPWMVKGMTQGTPICPTCRLPISSIGHAMVPFQIYGDASTGEQHEEIVDIRERITKVMEFYTRPSERVMPTLDQSMTDAERGRTNPRIAYTYNTLYPDGGNADYWAGEFGPDDGPKNDSYVDWEDNFEDDSGEE